VLEDGRESGRCDDHTDIVAGRYRLGPVLSRSADSCAHRAYDELLQRTVRVTLAESGPAQDASFSLRPQGWQARDPEVAELFDAGHEHDRLFLVTHHPDEPTLAETTPPGGLDLGQLRDLGTAVATALVPRHRRGAAHGGLGAGTVAFSPNGTSLAEFGLLPWLARWGDVPVTPPYLAPEQRSGADSGPASDVYALGRLLTELAPDHGLRPGLRALLAAMTAESPSARPSMAEVQRRLSGRGRRRPTSGAGRRLGLAAAACCLVGLTVGMSAFAGEVPAVGSAGATLAATAAVPTPVLPLAPLPPPSPAGVDDAASGHTSSGHTASAVTASAATASARSASSGTRDSTADSPRVVDALQRTSTGSHARAGSDSTDRSPRSTTTRQDQDQGATPAPTRSSQHATGRSDHDATRSGHQVGGVLTQIGASLGHHAQSRSGKDNDDAGRVSAADDAPRAGDEQGDPPTPSRTLLGSDLMDAES
jgi:serine/threonine protein kinase